MADDGGQMEVDGDSQNNSEGAPDIVAMKEAAREVMEEVKENGEVNGGGKVNGIENGDPELEEEGLEMKNGKSNGGSVDNNEEEEDGDSNEDTANGDDDEDAIDENDDDDDEVEEVSSPEKDKTDDAPDEEEEELGNGEVEEVEDGDKDDVEEVMEVDDEDIKEMSAKPSDKSESDVVELENEDKDSREKKDNSNDDKEVEEVMKPKKSPKKKKKEVTIEEVSLDEDAPSLRRSSRKKTPTKYHEIMEKEMMEEEDFEIEELNEVEEVQDVEEIKDDDSDIQEVEPEDPLGGSVTVTASTKSDNNTEKSSKPNVVTIDDLRTLQKLAVNAKQSLDFAKQKESLTIIDTNSILAGKMGSGVSITPAKPKTTSTTSGLNITPVGLNLGSGVSIRPNNPSPSSFPSMKGVTVVPVGRASRDNTASPAGSTASSSGTGTGSGTGGSGSGFGYNSSGELTDPNLTDDTYVVEAPSFIVPYVYEKPPLETFKDFKESIEKMTKELEEKKQKEKEEKKKKKEEKAKRREERKKRRDDGEEDVEEDSESEAEEEEKEKDDDDESVKSVDEDNKENEDKKEEDEKKDQVTDYRQAFFKSTLGKFFIDLGMNRVQEYVQSDLLNQQRRKAQKEKSAAIMHAIKSLQRNLEDSQENNAPFKFDMKKCRFCSFRTESRIVMQHHMETPHMRNFVYRCNFCDYETKVPQEVLFHMEAEHNVKGKLERAPYFHQCPQCPFEDNGKGKLTRHKVGCDKRFKPETNLLPERDWDAPAKIRPPPVRPSMQNNMQGRYPGQMNQYMRPGQALLPKQGQQFQNQRFPQLQRGGGMVGGRGRPVGSYKQADLRIPQPQLSNMSQQQLRMRGMNPQMLASQQMLAALNQQGLSVSGGRQQNNANLLVPNLVNSGSVTIQSLGQRSGGKGNSPSISITPLPGRNNPGQNRARQSSPSTGAAGGNKPGAMKPGQPSQGGKGNFVICEICDGYIKDLEQLRNHMQWIHKVKIHPKMIYNRPPLNCQKCQFRFFTDQGLERHLLGSHGLVTASMQDAANKGQDSGRCPVCGKVYQWKLLNHVSKDHGKTLKPAHLSYKCTVCTATFGQYKLFENHVYTAHSGVAKKAEKAKQAAAAGKQQSMLKAPVKLSDEITIIPAKKQQQTQEKKKSEVINLDDEEEIDDVEDTEVIDLETPKKDAKKGEAAESSKASAKRNLEDDGDEEPEKKKGKKDDEAEKGDDDEEEDGGEK